MQENGQSGHRATRQSKPHAQPFSEHVRELRARLFISVSALIIGCGIGYAVHERVLTILRRPLHTQLYYTTPTGGFNAIIRISILVGVVISTPVFIYQLGKFLSPTFKHKFKAARVLLFSTLLAALGSAFAYYISLPAAIHFLANVDTKDFRSLITINEYLNFVFAYLVGFALLFQLPLILLFINRIKPQKPGRLMRFQRWVILISFIVAAILTPTPDPINQTIMALPIVLLYQFSIMLIWFVNRKRRIQEAIVDSLAKAHTQNDTQPAGYSAAAYGASSPFPAPASAESAAAAQEPQIIRDIFAAPKLTSPQIDQPT